MHTGKDWMSFETFSHKLLFCILTWLLLEPGTSLATPILALKEADNCGGCHRPGRGQLPVLWRRCTLDCAGCHVDPNGAAARNEWGYYYTHDQLASFNFFNPIDPLQDDAFFYAHYDARWIRRSAAGETRDFPMSQEYSLRLKLRTPVADFHVSRGELGLGRIGSTKIGSHGGRDAVQRIAFMVDALPMNLYLRAARGQPVYGQRRPNHSLWIRERIGLDQYASTDSVSFGGSPNVPFFHVSMMQGDRDRPEAERQKGSSWHAGFRGVTAAWHVSGSGWNTSSETTEVEMEALGLGANLFQLILYAERNWRKITQKTSDSQILSEKPRVHPSSEITELTLAGGWIPGVIPGMTRETMLNQFGFSERISYFIDLHPIPFLQIEFWRRNETGLRNVSDTLAVVHIYLDL